MNEEQATLEANAEVVALQAELTRAQADAAELREMLEASQADFRNFKRRTEAEREVVRQRANRGLILELLPLLDDLRRGLASRGGRDAWSEGIGHILRKFEAVLEREGLRRMETLGQPFDPNRHEAVAEREDGSVPAGHVAEVVRDGFLLGDEVLRPAQVVVARKPTIRVQRVPAQPARSSAPGGRRPNTIDPFDNWIQGGKRWPRY
jgi:molecular chaperone GrpE